MLVFCPDCGTRLQVEEGSDSLRFVCSGCGFQVPVSKPVSRLILVDDVQVTSRIYPRLKDLDEVLGGI